MATQRIRDEPGFMLHHYDWSESSSILEVFTRGHGRVVLLAKGVKKPFSSFRSVLLPFQSVLLGWSGGGEIHVLKQAQWAGGPVMPIGDALICGFYANELLLRMLAREDAHPVLFDRYVDLLHILSSRPDGATMASVLRSFELCLLQQTGHLPELGRQSTTLDALHEDLPYALTAALGLQPGRDSGADVLTGRQWLALSLILQATPSMLSLHALLRELMRWSGQQRNALRRQLRALLDYHCGQRSLKTRLLMREIQDLIE